MMFKRMNYFFSIIILLFLACKTTHNAPFSVEVKEDIYSKSDHCPENGECSIELIPNKSIVFKTDNIGILYPVISEGEKTIFKIYVQKKSNSKYSRQQLFRNSLCRTGCYNQRNSIIRRRSSNDKIIFWTLLLLQRPNGFLCN